MMVLRFGITTRSAPRAEVDLYYRRSAVMNDQTVAPASKIDQRIRAVIPGLMSIAFLIQVVSHPVAAVYAHPFKFRLSEVCLMWRSPENWPTNANRLPFTSSRFRSGPRLVIAFSVPTLCPSCPLNSFAGGIEVRVNVPFCRPKVAMPCEVRQCVRIEN